MNTPMMVKEAKQSSTGKELEQTSIRLSKLSVIVEEGSNNNNDDDEELLKTPTGPEHKIPPLLQCPGAPPGPKNRYIFDPASPSPRFIVLKFKGPSMKAPSPNEN
ncbi:hypothetical protein L195_g004209 [Trifolium pratense]|uniref:Uncharacterized protein n=1 Tax=Trifolium pratense TaxID=57577 RepID=A0A2K3NXF1_TRIPR|nr:hypothetical protein L195_g004209 [Trifolium pratense]